MKITDLLNEAGWGPITPVVNRVPGKIDLPIWVRAFKKIDAGGTPVSDVEWAVKLKMEGVPPDDLSGYSLKGRGIRGSSEGNVNDLLSKVPPIDDLEKAIQDKETSASQQAQSSELGKLQHELNIQQLIQQSQLDKVDTQALVQMDVAARQAIRQKQQDMELEAKERLAQIEIDIRKSKEGEQQREFELKKAQQSFGHEMEIIKVTAEGEYKKAKLEADYQLHIKQLENIDNAQERQNRLDTINAEKQKEIATINANTNARITELSAETDAKRAESDIRIHEEFMMKFKDAWGNMITKASETGKTLGQNISAVMGALGRLSKPIMPKSQQPAESIAYFRDLISEMDKPMAVADEPAKDISLSREEWDAKFKSDPEIEIVNPLRMMPKDGSYFRLAMRNGQAVGVSKGSMLGRSAFGPETHSEFAAPKSVARVLKDLNLEKFGPQASAPTMPGGIPKPSMTKPGAPRPQRQRPTFNPITK